MAKRRGFQVIPLRLLPLALIIFAPLEMLAQTIVGIPSPQSVVNMTRGVAFNYLAVTDEPVPPEAKRLNPQFSIKVFFRAGIDKLEYRPESGAVFAKVVIAGVPAKRLLPDGEYYLWIGGEGELQRGALAKIDGTFIREVEVFSKPNFEGGPATQAPEILSTISIEEVVGFATTPPGTPPGGGVPPRVPPTDPPKPPPPPPGRTWREVRVPWTPNPDGSIPPPRWVRIPDN